MQIGPLREEEKGVRRMPGTGNQDRPMVIKPSGVVMVLRVIIVTALQQGKGIGSILMHNIGASGREMSGQSTGKEHLIMRAITRM